MSNEFVLRAYVDGDAVQIANRHVNRISPAEAAQALADGQVVALGEIDMRSTVDAALAAGLEVETVEVEIATVPQVWGDEPKTVDRYVGLRKVPAARQIISEHAAKMKAVVEQPGAVPDAVARDAFESWKLGLPCSLMLVHAYLITQTLGAA